MEVFKEIPNSIMRFHVVMCLKLFSYLVCIYSTCITGRYMYVCFLILRDGSENGFDCWKMENSITLKMIRCCDTTYMIYIHVQCMCVYTVFATFVLFHLATKC